MIAFEDFIAEERALRQARSKSHAQLTAGQPATQVNVDPDQYEDLLHETPRESGGRSSRSRTEDHDARVYRH